MILKAWYSVIWRIWEVYKVEKAKKKAKNYVCTRCFKQITKCTCDFAPHGLVQIDEPMQQIVQYANANGITTLSCCSGHYEDIGNRFGTDMHIQFLHPFFEPPTGFCAEGSRHTDGYTVIRHRYKKQLTKEEFEAERDRCANNVMLWLKDRIEEG